MTQSAPNTAASDHAFLAPGLRTASKIRPITTNPTPTPTIWGRAVSNQPSEPRGRPPKTPVHKPGTDQMLFQSSAQSKVPGSTVSADCAQGSVDSVSPFVLTPPITLSKFPGVVMSRAVTKPRGKIATHVLRHSCRGVRGACQRASTEATPRKRMESTRELTLSTRATR